MSGEAPAVLALRMGAAVAELANSAEGKALITQWLIKKNVPVEQIEAHAADQGPPVGLG